MRLGMSGVLLDSLVCALEYVVGFTVTTQSHERLSPTFH